MEFTVKTKLDLSGFREVENACKALSKKVEVGILHNAEEAKIASLQHYGGTGVYQYGPFKGQEVDVPPRPFLSHAMDFYGKGILKQEAQKLEKGFTAENAESILNDTGKTLMYATQETIREYAGHQHEYPYNSERTVETKGKDSPLIDTGKMLSSIEYEVIE